ncbi:putative WRKY transcription factor 13 [Hibiscus syriacus]|uniref:WRKY transcription factor 13 n=1 Tax=Hibiscus syriacus TaxID=106335 RepID=A0A6A3AV10_HIBSY|nr:probable WRKY transcription factor 13 [Hibiscus syriacus]KAE8706925.1 putative WRKY transcription factor 13 [Hibiscus syriacus]
MPSSSHQAMLNQGLFEEKEKLAAVTQMGFYTFPQNLTSSYPPPFAPDHALPDLSESETLFSQRHRVLETASDFGGPQLPFLHRSTANFRPCGNECLESKKIGVQDHQGVCAMKMKRIKARRKVREPRFCFKTMSDVDVLDDGYKWRKYGQKVVKNTQHPRSYYRCTQDNCGVKKRVERLGEDPRMVITSYEGRHAHSPPHHLHDSNDSHSHLNNFF